MAATTSLEFYFSVDRMQRAEPPLLFHHGEGAPGLSFRQKIARLFNSRGSGQVEIPKAKAGMKIAGNWPAGFVAMFRSFEETVGLQAVLSQHTAELADVTDAPILSVLADPDITLAAAIESRWRRLATTAGTQDFPALIAEHGLANPQARSLVRLKIPGEPPDNPEQRARWAAEADRIAARFTLFRSEAYEDFLAHCRDHYGIPIDGAPDKIKRASAGAQVAPDLRRRIIDADPMWFDRMLHERARGFASGAARRAG